jgi:hypothetical protein
MTNATLLRLFKQKKTLKQKHQNLEKKFEKLTGQLENLNEQISYANMVNEVYKGVCLRGDVNGDDHINNLNFTGSIWAAADKSNWYGEFWRNVNRKSEWRVKLHSREVYWKEWKQQYYITGLTREEALTKCKEWAAFGKAQKAKHDTQS